MADRDATLQLERYTPEAKYLVSSAQQLADERQHGEVTPLHLLSRALERDRGVGEVFRRCKVEPGEVVALCEASLRKLPAAEGSVAYVSARLLDLLLRAEREAAREKSSTVGVEHLLHALAQELRGPAGEILSACGIEPGGFRPHVGALKEAQTSAGGGSSPFSPSAASSSALGEGARDLLADARAGRFDPVIGRDVEVRRLLQVLERRTKNHPLVVGEAGVGKTALIRALAMRLVSGDVPAHLGRARLVELDTGALVAGAKLRGEIEQKLKVLLSTLRARDDAETILVVEEIDTLFGQGVQGSGVGELLKPHLQRGDIRVLATTTPEGLKRIAERDAGILRRLATLELATPSVDQAIEMVRGVASRYERHHRVSVSEGAIVTAVQLAKRYVAERALPDSALDLLDETAARKRVELDGLPPELDHARRRIESLRAQLEGLAEDTDRLSTQTRTRLARELSELELRASDLGAKYEGRRAIRASLAALRLEASQTRTALAKAREQKDESAITQLEKVSLPAIEPRLASCEEAARREGVSVDGEGVDENDVAKTLTDWTGIPAARMLEGEAEKLLKMEVRLAQRVVGQDEAVRAIARAVRRGRVGLRDPGKPIGSFLFLGPSGVGKTELAKALAEFLFDDEQALTRLDMSEFMERHMAQRLIGAPPGYADSEQGGFLTEAARRRPYSVLLFDEVEKAHADVFNLLLQVLDDGRLTDGRGRLADFSNTVVILTSNIGSQRVLETSASAFESVEGREALRDVLFTELRSFFRPEFLNRIDDIVVFKPLAKTDLRGIVDIQLRRLGRMLTDKELRVELSDGAKDRLVELGYEPGLGARPLKRAILRELQNPLAEAILAGGYGPGDTVSVDVIGEAFVFAKRQEPGPGSSTAEGLRASL